MNKRKMFITFILFLIIGFAAVSTTLIINGRVGIGSNQDHYVDGLVFYEDSITTSEGTTFSLSESGRTITLTTPEMKSIDETASVNFKLKNYSQYNATLETPAISCYFVDSYVDDTKTESTVTTHEYMEITPGTELDGDTINAGGQLSEESHITITQIKSYIEDTQSFAKFQCEINTIGSDSDTPAVEKPVRELYELVRDVDENGEVSIGDEIAIGEEHFHVITNNESKLEGLAKFNLKVGSICDKDCLNCVVIPFTEPGYGIQDQNMRAYVAEEERKGVIQFSKAKGWYEATPQHMNPIDIRNPAYRVGDTVTADTMTALDALYTTNGTVTGYEEYLKGLVPESKISKISVRFINKSELKKLKSVSEYTSWLYYTSYFSQTAYNSGILWIMNTNGFVGLVDFYYGKSNGVRPVITISKE